MRLTEPETLPELLNKVGAICACGAGTYTELAKFLGKPVQRVSEWVGQRTVEPGGAIAFEIKKWAARKTLAIAETGTTSRAGRELHRKYRSAFYRLCEKFPPTGERKS